MMDGEFKDLIKIEWKSSEEVARELKQEIEKLKSREIKSKNFRLGEEVNNNEWLEKKYFHLYNLPILFN